MTRVLVVEDNRSLAQGLKNNLEIEGYEVAVAGDGAEALARVREFDPALVVLDLMLPRVDGYRVLKQMRDDGLEIPVLILTAKDQEADKVRGFRLGADDYVTKPFGILELMARVNALVRRAAPKQAPVPESFGDVQVLPDRRAATKRGQDAGLTPMEFDLLIALLKRRGALVTRLQLLKEVWGHSAAVLTRTVDTHIAELRRKLEDDPAKPQHILTVRKAGYRLELGGS
ncbi:MAG: response regulator transcription factor [Vicinamibacterales bacterium]